MESPDSSLLGFGERFLPMSSRCGHWFWTDGWHLSWIWRLRYRFLTFRFNISTAEGLECQHEGQTILFSYWKALTMNGICSDACWDDVSRLPRCLRQQRLLYCVLTYAVTPHTNPSSGIKSQDWVWPISSLVFSALVRSCGDLWWRQFKVVKRNAKRGANANDQ